MQPQLNWIWIFPHGHGGLHSDLVQEIVFICFLTSWGLVKYHNLWMILYINTWLELKENKCYVSQGVPWIYWCFWTFTTIIRSLKLHKIPWAKCAFHNGLKVRGLKSFQKEHFYFHFHITETIWKFKKYLVTTHFNKIKNAPSEIVSTHCDLNSNWEIEEFRS